MELLGDLAVHAGQDAVEEFDHGHLGPQPSPDRAELQADDAGADHQELRRRLGERQRAGGGDDRLLVDLDAGQLRNVGAGRDDDVLGLERRFLAVAGFDEDLARSSDPPLADDPVDLVLLEQKRDAVDVGGDGVVLVLHQRRHIEFGRADDDSQRRQFMRGLLEHFGGVEQRLRRDATDVEARAAERLHLLDHGDLHAELCRTDRAHITGGAGADHDDIMGHGNL